MHAANPSTPFIPFDEMTAEEREKSAFVTGQLACMLECATRGWVEAARYVVDAATNAEVVWVEVSGDRMIRVNVSGDSEWAIAKDVMRVLAGKYE